MAVLSAVVSATAAAMSGGVSATSNGGGGADAGGGGGGGDGGIIAPILLGAQRFASSDGLGIPTSQLQRSVTGSLGWIAGEVRFLSPPSDEEPLSGRMNEEPLSGRMLIHASGHSQNATSSASPQPDELLTLINVLITAGVALALTVALQLTLILSWRHLINRRYYQQQQAIAEAAEAKDGAAFKRAVAWDVGPERFLFGLLGPKRRLKPPKFRPFPKSLVWPTPLFFSTCMFFTGLTRASVRILAASPDGCGSFCLALPVVVLSALVTFMLLTARAHQVSHPANAGPWTAAMAAHSKQRTELHDPKYTAA